jgi:hypothetical protein
LGEDWERQIKPIGKDWEKIRERQKKVIKKF